MSDQSGRERGSSSQINRRSVLRGIAAGGTAAVGLGAMTGSASAAEEQCLFAEEAPDDQPYVEYDSSLLGDAEFAENNVPEGEEEVLIYLHGWLELFAGGAVDQGYTLQLALEEAGYEKPVITYKYPSNNPFWWTETGAAEDEGRAFAGWLADYRDRNPDTTIRMIGHSLGARTGLGCLDEHVNVNGNDPVRSFDMLGGAIARDAVTVDGEFADAITNGAEEVNNYHSEHDGILDHIFQIGEFGTEAVGAYGAPEGAETPDNYYDLNVRGTVKGHCLYYKPEEGCIDTVVENFPPGFQGGADDGGWLGGLF
jgi:pimeloyl-ACP methyl ester carboxylesterase